jgi:hypothetical protein
MVASKPAPRRNRLALALMLSSSLTLVALARPALAQNDPGWNVYASSSYTYCDAKLISDLWGISIDSAKSQIGQKIMHGIDSNLPSILAASRQAGHRCGWDDTQYSYNDAVQLSQLWGVGVQQAKAKVANYVTNGQNSVVIGALGHGLR